MQGSGIAQQRWSITFSVIGLLLPVYSTLSLLLSFTCVCS
uniref:Uncharacterized protein n=1 Tax=Anguilla anguilla TaxID=7936 RepID=A0A0E9SVD7_ANGAN